MKVLIGGDYAPRHRLVSLVDNGDYEKIFEDVKDIIKTVDYSIVNFESPIVENDDSPILKSGPNLHCKKNSVDLLKYAGFDCVTLANNHIRDYGDSAVLRTINYLQNAGIDVVGAGKDIGNAAKILYHNHGDKVLSVVNCCENEFSIATEKEAGANPLNPIRQYYEIKEACEKSDYVLVIVHGGHELHQLPSPRMQELYRFFVDAGADAVVNGHQHCFSGYEFYKGKPIVYGLGNLCFDNPKKKHDIWNEGYMVEIEFLDINISLKLLPYTQCNDDLGVHLLKNRELFDKKINDLNSIISSSEALREATNDYYKSTESKFIVIHEPYNNIWLKKLYAYHLLPSFISKKRMLKMLNFIECESQRDRHIAAIKDKLKI